MKEGFQLCLMASWRNVGGELNHLGGGGGAMNLQAAVGSGHLNTSHDMVDLW